MENCGYNMLLPAIPDARDVGEEVDRKLDKFKRKLKREGNDDDMWEAIGAVSALSGMNQIQSSLTGLLQNPPKDTSGAVITSISKNTYGPKEAAVLAWTSNALLNVIPNVYNAISNLRVWVIAELLSNDMKPRGWSGRSGSNGFAQILLLSSISGSGFGFSPFGSPAQVVPFVTGFSSISVT